MPGRFQDGDVVYSAPETNMPFSLRAFRYPALMLVAACSLWATNGGAVTVMTQNMDAGTDLGFVLAYINTSTPTVGIDLTYQEIKNTPFAARAAKGVFLIS